MGYWSFYFIAKVLLYAGGHLNLHVGANLALAALVALPASAPRHRFAKNLLAVPLGVALLYYDSWLPPFRRVLESLPELRSFSAPYLAEVAGRLIDLRVLLLLALGFALFLLASRKLRMSTFAVAGLVLAALLPPPGPGAAPRADPRTRPAAAATTATELRSPEALDQLLREFREREARRRVEPPALADGEPYDIVLLHVCSLAWDDLDAVGLANDPFLRRFDFLFTHFDGAASYSGPAAIRLLRANCGQAPHRELYAPASPACYLVAGLENAGFEPHWVMNHDGHFGNFYADVRVRGGLEVAPVAIPAPIAQHAFDGTPVYDDYAVLSGWWARRLANPAERTVLYYNTISLHDGNRLARDPGGDALVSYRNRARLLFADLARFLDELAASKRRVVVVFIPEHGAALRGERRQISGLREVPSAAITSIPVGIALIGGAPAAHAQQVIAGSVSYLALAEVLARIVAHDPFAADAAGTAHANLIENLPETLPVAENEGTVVMQVGGTEQVRTPDDTWSAWRATPQ